MMMMKGRVTCVLVKAVLFLWWTTPTQSSQAEDASFLNDVLDGEWGALVPFKIPTKLIEQWSYLNTSFGILEREGIITQNSSNEIDGRLVYDYFAEVE